MIILASIELVLLIVASVAYFLLYKRQQQVIEINQSRKKENETIDALNYELNQEHNKLMQQIDSEKAQLEGFKISISAQENIITSLRKTEEEMRRCAEERANQSYEARLEALDRTYQEKEEQLKNQHLIIIKKVASEQEVLDALKAKQLAYIEAQQRAEQMELERDYYRLVLSDTDLQDVGYLRELQDKFHHKDVIDKVIWENYYRSAFDVLSGHMFQPLTAKISGIYKITNQGNGKAYIGQSVDIRERWRQHIKSGLSASGATNKLYQEMKKYGLNEFTFEILEKVPKEKLNERETYWIDFYKTKEFGMNGTKGNAS